jgi:protoporphyrinogen/coproporphyrinogen III oxidase
MLMVPTRILPLVGTRLLSWPTKIRMGLECLRQPAASPREDRSVAEFIRDHYGREAVDYLAEPLLSGVYGGDPEQLSVSSVLGLFADMEGKYGSLTRGVLAQRRRRARQGPAVPLFQTLKAGLGSLVQALKKATASHLSVITGDAGTIERRTDGLTVRWGGTQLEASSVVLACQAYEAGALVGSIDPQLAGLLDSVPYNSSVTVALGYRKSDFDGPTDGFGFLIPKSERRRLVACTWVGTKFAHRVPDDKVMLRCFLGGEPEETDDQLVHVILGELRDIMGVTAAPIFTRVSRWPRSMAQYTVGHRQRIDQIEARLGSIPGLYLAGNAYSGIGVPDCARTGKQAAEKIMASEAARR